MNTLSILKKLFLLFISFSIFSCGSDDSEPDFPESDDSILTDYSIDIGPVKDFSVDESNQVYFIYAGYGSDGNGPLSVSIKEVNNSGDVTILDEPDVSLFGNEMGITNSGDGDIYFVTDSRDGGDKVYIYSTGSSSSSSYTMTPISSPFAEPVRMSAIENFGDDTYIAFDYSALGLRRYFPDLGTDVIIAGSGNSSITDGTGLNADFKFVTKILAVNEIIYVIDDSYNLRKVEKDGDAFNVTTLISDYTNYFQDITADKNGNILVLINNQGVYKLNTSDNSLEEYLTGEFKLTRPSSDSDGWGHSSEWGFVDKFLIDENDLYLYEMGLIVKISDFETKI